jgi:hypothetical protein|tara:strand:+ start:53 stop:199 length:147 start_codon:yes stop_codon:yes gene_type:complete
MDKMLEILESVKKREDIPESKKIDIIKKLVSDDLGKRLNNLKGKTHEK